jgi:hypothetical protein
MPYRVSLESGVDEAIEEVDCEDWAAVHAVLDKWHSQVHSSGRYLLNYWRDTLYQAITLSAAILTAGGPEWVKGGIVLALPEKAFGSRSRLDVHGIARKPSQPLSTQNVAAQWKLSDHSGLCSAIELTLEACRRLEIGIRSPPRRNWASPLLKALGPRQG